VLHDDEKEVGVALIDIGGGTTDIAVFEDNTIRHTAVIAVAGNKVTDDIRKGLGVMRDQAEQLKCQFGAAYVELVDAREEIRIPGIGGRPEKSIRRDTLAQVIQPRMEEILEIAAIEIKRSGYARHLGVGCVVTGGGALIPGTADLAAEIMGMEARIGRPMGLGGGLVEEVSDPKFATAVGLVLYGMRPEIIGGGSLREPAAPPPNARVTHTAGDGYTHGHPHRPSTAPASESAPGASLMGRIADRMKGWFDEL
jgi:cell division protein FtsA